MAVGDLEDPVATLRQRSVMGDEHQRRAGFELALEQQTGNRFRCFSIEIAGRLVGKEDLRLRGHRTGDRHALLLSTRKLGRIMVKPMAKADRLKLSGGPFKRLVVSGKFQRHGDIFQRRHGRQQVKSLQDDADMAAPRPCQSVLVQLSKVRSGDQHLSAARAFKARQHGHQRRLSRT